MNSKISLIILVVILTSLISPITAGQQSNQQDYKVISSDRNSLLVEYSPIYLDTLRREITDSHGSKQQYVRIEIQSGSLADMYTPGIPAIPQVKLNISVPSEFGNTIQVLSTTYKEINGRLIPNPKFVKEDNQVKEEYEAGAEYYSRKQNEELVSFGEYGLIRDLPVQGVIINPVSYDGTVNKIRLYTKILFRINFSSSQSLSNGKKDELSSGSVINYEIARYWSKSEESKNREIKKASVNNSVLSTGKWFRFEAPAEGIYRITRSMLSAYGIDAATVDPRTIKIYNNSGKMLPEAINASRPSDLVENAIYISGQEDGKFDEGDYILFYGRGSSFWDMDTTDTIKRFFNYYSKENFYFITSGGANGKRMSDKAGLSQAPEVIQTTTPGFADLEEEKINLLRSGRNFLGEDFSQTVKTRTYTNKLDGRITGTPINYKIRFINASSEYVGLDVFENSTTLVSRSLAGTGSDPYTHGTENILTPVFRDTLPDNRSVLKFNFKPTTVISKGYIDYFEISYTKSLSAFGDFLVFFSKDTTAITEYQLNGFSNSNIRVFDVTDYSNVKSVSNPSVQSGSEFRFVVQHQNNQRSKYIAIGNDNFKTPVNPVEIGNSNLHGTDAGARYVIITYKNFMQAAQRLKDYRQNQAKIKYSTTIVDVDQIYNEFGGGTKDPSSVRDFLKYAYENWQIKPEYVLFLGSGNYDYKNVEGFGTNYVVTWESEEDLIDVSVTISSYSTDDYFVKIRGTDGYIDLSPGRITVKTADEADNMVSKIIQYETDSEIGTWRNLITLISDDGYTSTTYEGADHTAPNETLAKSIIPKSFDFNKIYMAAYPVQLTSAGRRMPAVNDLIIKAMNDGTVIVNYVGHGSDELWAHEVVFEKNSSIPLLKNSQYFFLTAATCEFAEFDKPNFLSGTEALLLLPNAGCIGALSSTRAVYSSLNHDLMYEFFRNLFNKRDTLNLVYPIGYVNFLTKQRYNDINAQKYYIFGDPLLRLDVPQYSALIDSVNGNFININGPDTSRIQVKALSDARISGYVRNTEGNVWTDFNGEGTLTVFDSQRDVPLEAIGNFPMTLQGGVIFRGRISVNNGYFSANFVVPKDISYENRNGKVVTYFTGNNADGIGYTTSIIVGGTDSSKVNDGKGPEMEIYFDDTSFKDAYLVNPDSKLIVKLRDDTGLNTTGTGVGHKLEGILNDKDNDPIDFTNYFKGDLDSGGKAGQIEYKFNNLETGDYKMQIKAWDVFNNFTTETTYFSVVSGDELVLRDIYNYPNPFKDNTTFTFQLNLDKQIDVKIKVYTIAGRLIREIEKNDIAEKFVKIEWDGRDEDGSPVANGTYLYKVVVKTTDGSYSNSALGKLAVIR